MKIQELKKLSVVPGGECLTKCVLSLISKKPGEVFSLSELESITNGRRATLGVICRAYLMPAGLATRLTVNGHNQWLAGSKSAIKQVTESL
jgi:hypothetical protein